MHVCLSDLGVPGEEAVDHNLIGMVRVAARCALQRGQPVTVTETETATGDAIWAQATLGEVALLLGEHEASQTAFRAAANDPDVSVSQLKPFSDQLLMYHGATNGVEPGNDHFSNRYGYRHRHGKCRTGAPDQFCGRAEDNDVVLCDRRTSRQHLKLEPRVDGLHLRRFLETHIPACLSFRPSYSLRQQLHSPAMRLLACLEDKRKSFALWYVSFRQSPE